MVPPSPTRRLLRLAVCAAVLGLAGAPHDSAALCPAAHAEGRDGKQAAPSGPIVRTPEFEKRVSDAIERGVAWLFTRQRADGRFDPDEEYPGGMTALCYHALRTCGVPADHPRMVLAYDALKAEFRDARDRKALRVYAAGLMMMAIADHAIANPLDRAAKEEKGSSKVRKDQKATIRADDQAWMNDLVTYLHGCRAENGAWRYGQISDYGSRGLRNTRDHDFSNTQYAILGLRAAAEIGCTVKSEIWSDLLRFTVISQEPTGPEVAPVDVSRPGTTRSGTTRDRARGWGYYGNMTWVPEIDDPAPSKRDRKGKDDGPPRPPLPPFAPMADVRPYGSMTAACVANLVICRSELLGTRGYPAELDRNAEQAIRDGIAWIGAKFSIPQNPGNNGWDFYWMYSLERAADLAGVERVGTHDWYGEGAEYLVANQERLGSWRAAGSLEQTTSWALLFLRRGTKPVNQAGITKASSEQPIRWEEASKLADRDFEDFVDMLVARWTKAPDAAARTAIARGAASLGSRPCFPLLRRMDDPDAATRRAAHAILASATGLTHPFDPDGSAETRQTQIAAFEMWWMSSGPKLRYDASKGRLVE